MVGLPISPKATSPVRVAVISSDILTVPKAPVADTPDKFTAILGITTVPTAPVADTPVGVIVTSGVTGTEEYDISL